MAPRRNTEARRAQIVDAFLSVVAERGYDGASVAEVAKTAGLNQGLIHYHFADKQAILLEALRDLALRHETRLDAAFDEAGADPLRRISAFIEAHLGLGAYVDRRALVCWVVMGSEASRRPAVRQAYETALVGLTARLVQTLGEAKDAGLIAHPEPEAAAMALMAVVQGYFELSASAPGRIPAGSAAPSARAMAEGLLKPKRPLGSL